MSTIINGITYTVSGSTAYVSAANNATILPNSTIEGSISIESTNYIVTSIGEMSFIDCLKLSSIIIPPESPTIGPFEIPTKIYGVLLFKLFNQLQTVMVLLVIQVQI